MPQATDLMNRGVPAALSTDLGYTAVTLAGTGATQGAAALIQPDNHMIIMTTTTAAAASVVFSANAPLGTPVFVANDIGSGVTGNVFCATGGFMNGTTNGSILLTTGQCAMFIQTTNLSWKSIKTA